MASLMSAMVSLKLASFFFSLFSLIAGARGGRLALSRPAYPLSLTTLWPLACGEIGARRASSLSLNQ